MTILFFNDIKINIDNFKKKLFFGSSFYTHESIGSTISGHTNSFLQNEISVLWLFSQSIDVQLTHVLTRKYKEFCVLLKNKLVKMYFKGV